MENIAGACAVHTAGSARRTPALRSPVRAQPPPDVAVVEGGNGKAKATVDNGSAEDRPEQAGKTTRPEQTDADTPPEAVEAVAGRCLQGANRKRGFGWNRTIVVDKGYDIFHCSG